MGRKKKRSLPEQRRIFCYYCEKTLQTEQTLLTHQREKHLRCPICHKRMLSIPSMTVHAAQMHNHTLRAVPNALPNRSDVSIDVLGMNGIPPDHLSDTEPPSAKHARLASQHPPAPPLQQPYPPQMYTYPSTYNYNLPPPAAYPPQTPAATTHVPPYYQHQVSYPNYSYPYHPPSYAPPPQPYHSTPAYIPPLPNSTYVANGNGSGNRVSSNAAPVGPVGPPVKPKPVEEKKETSTDHVKIIFDRRDLSMEEIRAKLSRYKVL